MAYVISDILKGLILYTPKQSFFYRLHPAVKLLLVAIMSVSILITPSHILAIINLAIVIFLVALGRAPVKALRLYSFVIGWMLLISFVFYSFFTPVKSGPVVATFGPLVVGLKNLLDWFLVALKFFAVSYLTALWLVTTKHRDLAVGLRTLKMPYIVSFVMASILRNLAVVSVDLFTIIDAQSSRGLDFRKGNPIARLAKFVRVGIPLIYVSLKRTEEMSNAIAARGFSMRGQKTNYYQIPVRKRDYAFLAFIIAHLLAMVAAYMGLFDPTLASYGFPQLIKDM